MTNQITLATPAQAEVLAALHTRIFPHDSWNEAAFSALLSQAGHFTLLHEKGGFLMLRTVLDEAEILTFGVVQPRQGIGSALLHDGLHRLKKAHIQILHLEVAAHNKAAQLFYEKFGFVLTGRRKAYYEDGDDALLMRRSC